MSKWLSSIIRYVWYDHVLVLIPQLDCDKIMIRFYRRSNSVLNLCLIYSNYCKYIYIYVIICDISGFLYHSTKLLQPYKSKIQYSPQDIFVGHRAPHLKRLLKLWLLCGLLLASVGRALCLNPGLLTVPFSCPIENSVVKFAISFYRTSEHIETGRQIACVKYMYMVQTHDVMHYDVACYDITSCYFIVVKY